MLKPAEGQPITGKGTAALFVGVLVLGTLSLFGSACGRVGPTEVANTWVWALRADDADLYRSLVVPRPGVERGSAWTAERACLDWDTVAVNVEESPDAPDAAQVAAVDGTGRSLTRFLYRTDSGWRITVDSVCDED
ncbi:MAG: hypothetical protein R2761_29400 [Acidimicrobiales bacterium]